MSRNLDIGENTLRLYQRTDAAGYCTFTELPRDLPLKAFAFHSTLGRGNWNQRSLAENEAEAYLLELEKGPVTIHAIIKQPDGSRVQDARVLLLDRLPDADGVVREALGRLKRMHLEESSRFTFGALRSARSTVDGEAVFPDTFAGRCFIQAVSGDLSRSEILVIRAIEQDTPVTCELVLSRPLTLDGTVRTPGGEFVQGARVTLLTRTGAGEWEMNRHSFTNERGDYRFSDLDRGRSYAVGIQSSDASQWKLLPHRPGRELANEEFSTLIDRRNLRVDREDFQAFVEVPEDPESVTPRIDLVVEWKG